MDSQPWVLIEPAYYTRSASLRDYGADMLFQGMLDELRRRDASVDPGKLAAKLGFQGSKWKTLETGCGNEIELHFVDATTDEFGLNNYVYVLKKE